MAHETYKSLLPLSESNIRHLHQAGFKCKLKLPKSFCPPNTVFCEKPIAFVAQQKAGGRIDWWYSCEDCAKPIAEAIG